MATRQVPFEFYCGNSSNKLTFKHDIPSGLIGVGAKFAQNDTGYIDRAQSVIRAVMKEYEPACLEVLKPRCGICGSPRTKLLHTPITWLHLEDDPSVSVWVHGVCNKGKCEIKMRQQTMDVMAKVARDNDPESALEPRALVEIMSCIVCKKVEGTMKCGRCKAVAYCGKEHQKADWKIHKQTCLEKQGN